MICSGCGNDVRTDGHLLTCPAVLEARSSHSVPSSLRLHPRTDKDDGRMGVKYQSASAAVTYTTENRGRGCRLHLDPALLRPEAGTMTRAEYEAWDA